MAISGSKARSLELCDNTNKEYHHRHRGCREKFFKMKLLSVLLMCIFLKFR
jgi:hypothetical protein